MKTDLMNRGLFAAMVALVVGAASAEKKGVAVFTDDFATSQTLAEHWLVEGEVKSEGGVLKLGKDGKVTFRGRLPEKYVLEWKEGVDLKPMRRESAKPKVEFCGERVIDDVVISQVADANASPNLVINSGFEYVTDDVPLYYCNRSTFKWAEKSGEDYERWLKCFAVDTAEKHSGRQSLKVTVDALTAEFWFYPWRTATQKGEQGVFTVWMKSTRPGLRVELEFGGAPRKPVELTTDWARYEIASTNMPAPGLFSPVSFHIRDCANNAGVVWIDDLQLEYGTTATPYRPSDLDQSRFGEEERYVRPPSVQVPRLPEGVKPSVALETWEQYAADAGRFRWKRQEPLLPTKAFMACDDDHLYIGYRNFGEDPKYLTHEHFHKDATSICMIDSTDVMFRTTEEKKDYHFFFAPNGDKADAYAENLSWDSHATVQARAIDGAVEYFITIPFADLAPDGFSAHWSYNLGRNDRHSVNQQCPGTSYTKQGDFRDDAYWMSLDLPAEVAKKWEGVAAASETDAKAEIVGRLDYYMTEPEARFRVYDESGKVEEVAIDIAKMPCGTNAVTLKAFGRDWRASVVKLPPKQGAVQRNHFARCLERNGEKILMANHCLIVRENPSQPDGHHEMLSLIAKRGFRSVHLCCFSDRKTVEKMRKMAEEAKSLGLDVLLWTGDTDGETITRTETREILYDLDNVLSRIAVDEPELHYTGEYVKGFLQAEKKFFPYCPVMMNNTSFGFPSRFADLATDVFMLDAYFTAAEFGKIGAALRNVDVMVASDRSTPCWFFLTGVNTLHYKQPSYAEQFAQCWSTICAGCSGLSWFVNLVSSEGNWRAMVDFNREAQELKDFILTEEITPPVRCSADVDHLRVRASKCGDDWYLFTVSIDEDPQDQIVLTLPDAAPQNGTAEVLYENRTVEISGGRIVDDYAPFARHIYKVKKDCRIPVFEDRFADSVLFAQRWDFVGESAKHLKFERGAVKFPGDTGDGIVWKGVSSEGCVAEAEIMRDGRLEVVRFSPDVFGRIVVGGFESPVEVHRVTVFAKAGRGINLVGNAGFEYDADGVPPGFCNRSQFAAEKSSAKDYTDKYLTSFRVDGDERHSGRQSLRLRVGPFLRSMELFAWGAPTEKGKSGVLSVWAKASEPDVEFRLRLGNSRKTVKLTTDWRRYEVTTTDLPAPGYFSPVWFEVPEVARRTTEASVWLDDVMFERVDAPEDGFVADRTYASAFVAKADDAAVFDPKPERVQTASVRRAPLTPAENALNGFALPEGGLVLGKYDFYMNEKTAGFRVWNEKGELEEKAVDISGLATGIHDVTVRAFGRDWKATVRKLAYREDATQINQWSRSLVHAGRPVVMCAPCLIGADVALRADGGATAIDVLAEAGFKYLHLENHPTVANIEKNAKLMELAAKRGMKFVVWPLEGDLSESGFIKGADGKASDWSRQRMYGLLDNENVLVQMAMDEPEYRKPDDVRAFMAREKARFPYKPVLMNNTWLGIDGRFAGLPTDILMLVYQLTCEGTTVGEVVAKVDDLRSIAPGKPCWYFLCGENSLHRRVPSYAEQVAQCWGAVAAGASGISWFVNLPTSKCNFEAMSDVNREILSETPFLASDELCGGAVADHAKVRCLTRSCGGERRVYAVLVDRHPAERVTVSLPTDLPPDAKIEVLYENRELQAENGVFSDAFAGFGRHVYRVNRTGKNRTRRD